MAGRRYYETQEILNDTLNLINKDRENWRKFLTFTSKHYKYNFEDILLIYAQRSEARKMIMTVYVEGSKISFH